MLHKKFLVILCAFCGVFLGGFLIFLISNLRAPSPDGTFKIAAIDPDLNPSSKYADSLRVKIIFTEPLDPKAFSYSLAPNIPLEPQLTSEGRQVILDPEKRWPEGIFSLIISKKTRSLTGENLDRDYSYQFQVGFDRGVY